MKVIFAGGGTGGHLFPGLALLEEMRRRTEVNALFVGTERGIEARVIPSLGERLELIDVLPLKGKSVVARVRGALRLPTSTWAATRILARERPDVVVGVGGYASGPMLAAARLRGVPCALLEQNAKPGITNRIAGTFVGRAYLTYPESTAFFRRNARVLGNPVRKSFLLEARRESSLTWKPTPDQTRILVLGGSQGAAALNRDVPAQIAVSHAATSKPLAVVHQCGDERQVEAIEARYRTHNVHVQVVPFIDDVAKALRDTDIVISRAGATGLAELTAIGRASILVPFPNAADDHQTANANALCAQNAAILVPQAQIESQLASELTALLRDAERVRTMASSAKKAGKPEAARDIIDDLFAWLGTPQSQLDTRPQSEGFEEKTSGSDTHKAQSWKRGEYAPQKRTRLVPIAADDIAPRRGAPHKDWRC